MSKKLLTLLVVAMSVLSMFTLVACGGNNSTTNGENVGGNTDNDNSGDSEVEIVRKLDVVKNIQYTKDGYKFTWDAVENADSYNIKVTSEGLSSNDIKANSFYYYPQDSSKPIKVQVQAVDSTGRYQNSDWSQEQTFMFNEESTLMQSITNFAKVEANGEYTGFISAFATTDLKGEKHLAMYVTSKVAGKNKLIGIHGDIASNVDISSLEKVVQSSPETYFPEEYFIAENSGGEVINSMEYLLQSDMNGTGLKSNYINIGYEISVVSSYTALDENDTIGKNFTIYAVVKATRGDEEKVLYVSYDCRIDNLNSSLEVNVTRGLMGSRYLKELEIIELTGDFAEASKLSANVLK